ncbi:MAG: hypothetical protein JWN24_5059, partial [Phycisphaerales bacterium]|nr:hypothetical protein [Phycisphaerales bacterium]MDB5358606.1 hypothetical protein [Phycisphaerales bacterium]
VWECQLRNPEKLAARLMRFLDGNQLKGRLANKKANGH